MISYPYTIDNGHGEQLTFLGRKIIDGTVVLEVENSVSPGAGPPMHVHHKQSEGLTVLEGRIGVEYPGKPPVYFGPGESIEFAPGCYHRFWNAGSETLKCRGFITPPDNIEYFLSALYASMRNSSKGRPSTFDAAWLLRHFRSEFNMSGIPAPVRKLVFPMVIFFGRLKGAHRKFLTAPKTLY